MHNATLIFMDHGIVYGVLYEIVSTMVCEYVVKPPSHHTIFLIIGIYLDMLVGLWDSSILPSRCRGLGIIAKYPLSIPGVRYYWNQCWMP